MPSLSAPAAGGATGPAAPAPDAAVDAGGEPPKLRRDAHSEPDPRWPPDPGSPSHYHLRDGGLYFLISRRPAAQLDADEQEIWRALDGAATLDDLRGRFGPAAEAAVRRFSAAGLCEQVPARFPEGRRRVLVIEPHMDDAVLSVGAPCGGGATSASSSCSASPAGATSRATATWTASTSTRTRSRACDSPSRCSSCACSAAATWRSSCRRLRSATGPAAGRWTGTPASRLHLGLHRAPLAGLRARGVDRRGARRPAHRPRPEVWFPIGVAPHTDHELTRNACLAALLAEPALRQGRVFRLYEEVPTPPSSPASPASWWRRSPAPAPA